MNALKYILKKYKLKPESSGSTEIPNVNRHTLARLFGELGYEVGVEIGTEQGKYARKICQLNPGVKLCCVDPWENYNDYKKYRPNLPDDFLEGAYEKTKKMLEGFDVKLIRKYSMDAVKDFEDESLDFVYIDGNHDLQNTVNDIWEWSKKVRTGGIVSGHDYRTPHSITGDQVVYAVNAYVQAKRIYPWFLLGERHPKKGRSKRWDTKLVLG